MFKDWTTDKLRALYRVAKAPHKGAYPFFRDPHMMIALRTELAGRKD
jgi:hypothetical protein